MGQRNLSELRWVRVSAVGTQLKFTGHHGYDCIPPHCRRSAPNVGLLAEDRPDSELLRMHAFDPFEAFGAG